MTDPNADPKAAALEVAFIAQQAVRAERKRLAPKVKALAEALADTRLKVQIMAHDLESTRRERDALAARLDGSC